MLGRMVSVSFRSRASFQPQKTHASTHATARDFIDACLTLEPTSRLTAQQAQQHPWLAPPPSPSLSATSTATATDDGSTTPDLLPTFREHADPKLKLKRSMLAVKAVGDFEKEGERRKSRREMWGEEERVVVEGVERARKEAEEEAVSLTSLGAGV